MMAVVLSTYSCRQDILHKHETYNNSYAFQLTFENGVNFHTYTFNIKRANAPETAPLENLLLIHETDGSYKEFLVTYNLTTQEREEVRNEEPIDTKG